MALPNSGNPISLSQIQAEFGGSNPISLSEYYGAASGVPTSGTISLSNFYGKSNATLTAVWAGQAYSVRYSAAFGPASSQINFTLTSGGVFSVSTAGFDTIVSVDTSPQGNWLSGGSASDYEVLFTYTTSSGAPGINNGASTWSSLSTTRTISAYIDTAKYAATGSGTITIQVRNASSQAIVATGTLTYTVQATSDSL